MRRLTLNEITRKVLLAEEQEGFFSRIGTAVSKTFGDARRKVFGMTDEEKVNSAVQIVKKQLAHLAEVRRRASKIAISSLETKFKDDPDLLIIVVDGKGQNALMTSPRSEKGAFDEAELSQLDATCRALTADARDQLRSDNLVFSDTRSWIYNLWQIKRLQDVAISPDTKDVLGAAAADYMKTCMLELPICWVIANTGMFSYSELEAAWRRFKGENASPYTAAYHDYANNMSYINLATHPSISNLGLNNVLELSTSVNLSTTGIIHEIMHAKSGYLDDVVRAVIAAFKKVGFEKREQGQTVSSQMRSPRGEVASPPSQYKPETSSSFTEKYRNAVRNGWGASIVESERPADATLLFSLMTKTYSEVVDINTYSPAELAANFDALLTIILTSSGSNSASFRIPNLAIAGKSQGLLSMIMVGKGKLSGVPGYTFNLKKDEKGDPQLSFITSTYNGVSGRKIQLTPEGVAYALDRAKDLSDEEHVYNSLTHLQSALEAFKRVGLRVGPGGSVVTVLGSDMTASNFMRQVASRKYISIDKEDMRRMACLLVAAATTPRGDLSPQFFDAVQTLAVRDAPSPTRAGSRALTGSGDSDVRSV